MKPPIIQSQCPGEGEREYRKHFRNINFEDRVVLDFGADRGSTPSFFLRQGASRVIAIEKEKDLSEEMEEALDKFPVEVYQEKITNPEDFRKYILKYEPDIVKIDIEGDEDGILDLENKYFKIPEYYSIEVHGKSPTPNIKDKMLKKMKDNEYTIKGILPINPNGGTFLITGAKERIK